MTENKKKRIKRYKMSVEGVGELSIFQLKDGLGIKLSKEGKKSTKHVTMLADSRGGVGAHVTDEKYPHKHPKRNSPLWRLDLTIAEKMMADSKNHLEPLIQRQLESMLNPDLRDKKLLAFPLFPDNSFDAVEAQGRVGIIRAENLGSIRVVNPGELDRMPGRIFFVLKKARVWWHSSGLLLKAPDNSLQLYMSNELLGEVFREIFRVGILPSEFAKQFPMRIKFRDSTIRAWQNVSGASTPKEIAAVADQRRKVALMGVSSNMLFFQTKLYNTMFEGRDAPPENEAPK